MTPINPAAAGSLPYDAPMTTAVSDGPDLYTTPESQDAGYAPATGYDPESYGGGDESYVSPVAGMQPATGTTPSATLQDFQALGIFTDDEIVQLHAMNLAPAEMGALYDEAVAFMQSGEFAQMQQEQQLQQQVMPTQPRLQAQAQPQPQLQPIEPAATEPAPAAPADAAAATSTTPAWNDSWTKKFQSALKDQGLDSQTRMMVVAQLKSMPLGEAELQQAFEYYTKSPEGLAELKAADEQVRSGSATQNKLFLGAGALALAGVAGTTALAKSSGNLATTLGRVATSAKDPAIRATAGRMVDTIKAGGKLTAQASAQARSLLASEAQATSRLMHPVSKLKLNAAARHLTPAAKLAPKEIAKYGLWMKSGDAATDAVKGAASATKAATSAGGAAGKVAAAGAGKAAAGAAQAAKGAGLLSKAGKFLGPAGLVLSAGMGVWGVKQTMKAEGGFGEESAKMTGNVAGGLAGGVAGAAAGAAIGSVVPVIGTGIGAVVGGLIGGFGGGAVGESIGGFIHGLFD